MYISDLGIALINIRHYDIERYTQSVYTLHVTETELVVNGSIGSTHVFEVALVVNNHSVASNTTYTFEGMVINARCNENILLFHQTAAYNAHQNCWS